MRLATWSDVYSHCFHPPPLRPANNRNEVRSANSYARRYLCMTMYIFPCIFSLGILGWPFGNGTKLALLAVRCWLHAASRKLGDVLGGGSFGWSESEISTREGGGEGELRRSGKVSILSLLFRYLWDGRECTICNNDNKKVGDLDVGV